MARCEYCTHGEICKRFCYTRIILCGDKADERCGMFSPKSEVERLRSEIADLQDALKCEKETNAHLCGEYMSAKTEVAREIFAEIVKILNSRYAETQHTLHGLNTDTWFAIEQHGKLVGITQIGDDLAELKKKYTEDQT